MTPDWLDRDAWPWTPHRYADPDGALHYVDVGEGRPFLFSHGTPTWGFEWRHAIRAMAGSARCIAVDHLGFGLSERPEAGYRPEDHAVRFARFADALDLSDVTVVVHDFGGPIALPWVLDHLDRVRRVVVVNTWAWPLHDVPSIAGPARLLGTGFGRWLYGTFNLSLEVVAASAWADRAIWRAVRDQYRPVFPTREDRTRVLWPLARALLASGAFYAELEARLDRLAEVPLDVVWGTRDPAFPTAFRDRWLARLPHARAFDVPDAGHWPHEERPEAVVAALRDDPIATSVRGASSG